MENTKEKLFQIDIPDTDTVIKEQSEWFKVDLPKKIIEHKKKPNWLRVKLPIGPKYTKLRKLKKIILILFAHLEVVPIWENVGEKVLQLL